MLKRTFATFLESRSFCGTFYKKVPNLKIMRALKRFGQNFLINEDIAKEIVDSLDIKDNDNIIEIGPGRGVLSRFLLKKYKCKNIDFNLKFIELDKSMCEILCKNFHNIEDKIINEDVLKLNFKDIFNDDKKIKIIGNFPYNISGKLINKIIENKDIIDEVVGMFQKEVVDRLTAKHNNKQYGIPSIFTQCYYNVEKLFDVSPENFNPQPQIMSSVCKFIRNNTINLDCNEKLFQDIVKRSFACRRKMIRNNLKYNDYYKHINEKYLNLRAENLSIDDFIFSTYILIDI